MLMLRHKLAEVVSKIDTTLVSVMHPPLWRDWKEYVNTAAVTAFTRNITGSEADYLRRALNQMEQAGSIQWDDPETSEEIALEEPYLSQEQRRQAHLDHARETRAKYEEKRFCVVLSDEQKALIASPDYHFPRLKVGSLMAGHLRYMWPCVTHRYADWGVVRSEGVINSLVKHGILEFVGEGNTLANTADIRTGPQFERALAKFGMVPRPTSWGKGLSEVDLEYFARVGRGEIPPQFPHKPLDLGRQQS